jgi:hypothetical protein
MRENRVAIQVSRGLVLGSIAGDALVWRLRQRVFLVISFFYEKVHPTSPLVGRLCKERLII